MIQCFWTQSSGMLQLRQDDVWKKVYFLKGIPVSAHSSLRTESLGQHLLSLGRITREDLQRVTEMMIEKGILQASALLNLELIKEHELFDYLKEISQMRIINTFSWKWGKFRFFTKRNILDHELIFNFNLGDLFLRGFYQAYQQDNIREVLNLFKNKKYSKKTYFDLGMEQLGFSEIDFSELFQGESDWRDLGNALTLLFWQAFGLIDIEKPVGLPSESHQKILEKPKAVEPLHDLKKLSPPEASHEKSSEGKTCVQGPGNDQGNDQGNELIITSKRLTAQKDFNELEDEVLSGYLQSRQLNYFELLGVTPKSSKAEIKKAFRLAARKYHPDQVKNRLRPQLVNICQHYFASISQAYEVLCDEKAKEEYVNHSLQELNKDLNDRENYQAAGVHGEALFLRGEEALAKGDLSGAREMFEKAHQRMPQEPQYKMQCNWLDYCINKDKNKNLREECKKHILASLRTDPNLINAHLYLGILMVEENQIPAGINSFQKVHFFTRRPSLGA